MSARRSFPVRNDEPDAEPPPGKIYLEFKITMPNFHQLYEEIAAPEYILEEENIYNNELNEIEINHKDRKKIWLTFKNKIKSKILEHFNDYDPQNVSTKFEKLVFRYSKEYLFLDWHSRLSKDYEVYLHGPYHPHSYSNLFFRDQSISDLDPDYSSFFMLQGRRHNMLYQFDDPYENMDNQRKIKKSKTEYMKKSKK